MLKPNDKLIEDAISEAVFLLKNGDKDAFHLVYNFYGQKVYRFCLRMTGDKPAAQDALQETFIRVFERSNELRGANFSAWLFTIARRVCLNAIRIRKSYNQFDENIFLAHNNLERDFALQEHIDKALQYLPVTLREALILREYEGYSYQEIADIIGVDLSLAKVRVHRARIAMRKMLAPVAMEWHES